MNTDSDPNGVIVTVCDDDKVMAVRAADLISQTIQSAIQARGRATLVLAGGSTPAQTYTLLAQQPDRFPIDWTRTYLFFGDERFVPSDDPNSNYAMAKRTLLEPADVPISNIFPIPTDAPSPAIAAEKYESTLTQFFADDPLHPPSFDLVLLGIGEDGHTASLFPNAKALNVTNQWVTATPPGTLPPLVDRITLTFPTLNAARKILFLVSGDKKANAVREIFAGHGPAARVAPSNGNVTWLIDGPAAGLISYPK